MIKEFNRVLWRDGDVITERHFSLLEEWIDDVTKGMTLSRGYFGLLGNALHSGPALNAVDSITCHQLDGIHWRADLRNLQFIAPDGTLARLIDSRSYEFTVKLSTKDDEEGHIYLYIHTADPGSERGEEATDSEVVKDIVLYAQAFAVTTSNDSDMGVPICRFGVSGSQIIPDESFIPFGLFIDSSERCIVARDTLLTLLHDLSHRLAVYFATLRPGAEHNMIWTLTAQLIRICIQFGAPLRQTNSPTQDFLLRLQQFLDMVQTEIRIFSVGTGDEKLRQKALQTVDRMARPIMKPLLKGVTAHYDLAHAFKSASTCIDAVIDFTADLPEGIKKEQWLSIATAALSTEGGRNKLEITLAEEARLDKGAVSLTFYFHHFTREEIAEGTVRIGLGNVAYGFLTDLRNPLRRMAGEAFSYYVEFPPELVRQSKVKNFTLYLPRPLGEIIGDIDRKIRIMVKAKE